MARAFRRLGDLGESARRLDQARQLGLDAERIGRERILTAAQTGRLREAERHVPRLLQFPGDGTEIW